MNAMQVAAIREARGVDTSRQFGIFAKTPDGEPAEVGVKVGQANLFAVDRYRTAAAPVNNPRHIVGSASANDPANTIPMFAAVEEELPPMPSRSGGSLVEKYRPRRLAEVVGQDKVINCLRSFIKNPYSVAFLCAGHSGTGKTATALALANELGCDPTTQELGGIWQIPSGEQSVTNVRALVSRLWNVPFYGSGWKTVIVNEADYMSPQVEAVWLDVLENLPPRTVIVFTTNSAAKMSDRFKDRCYGLPFTSKPENLQAAVAALAARIWKGETGRDDAPEVAHVMQSGQVSFRRLVQGIARIIDSQSN